jgi:hypothetical protein
MCTRSGVPSSHRTVTSVVMDASPAVATPTVSLSRYVVDSDRPWVRDLYSWAPTERVAEIARTHEPLTVTVFPDPVPTPYAVLLEDLSVRRGAFRGIAHTLLHDPSLNRRRYSWPFPYPTAMGFRGTSYGSALIHLALRDDALVLRLDPSDTQVFRLYDREQHEVPLQGFERERSRIAAVYHVRKKPDVPVAFREYVVCNAGALSHWDIARSDTCAELAAEHSLVQQLTAFTIAPERAPENFWQHPLEPNAPMSVQWAATMATAARHYYPIAANLRTLIEALAHCDTRVVTQ